MSMVNAEDILLSTYKYSWPQTPHLSLQDFLNKFKPSMVQNDGTKPWIWVRGSDPSAEDQGMEKATEETSILLQEVMEKVEAIKNDSSIPLRSNKKTGAKSKKEVREEVQVEASEKLKEISQKHGYVSGKWLIFASADKVDLIWATIATSLVSGPLASTAAFLTKVSTSPENEIPNYQHIICLYMPNVYDKEAVTEVMKILLWNHGVNLSGVKSDLYTSIGLDSKHPSGIPSTVWKNTALMKEAEIKELKDIYFAGLTSRKVEGPAPSRDVAVPTKAKPLKKKVDDDPFVSDDDKRDENVEIAVVTKVTGQDNSGHESEEEELKRKEALQSKKKTITKKKVQATSEDDSSEEMRKSGNELKKGSAKASQHIVELGGEDSGAEEAKRKKQLRVKKTAPKAKRAKVSDDEEDDRPMKRKATEKNSGI